MTELVLPLSAIDKLEAEILHKEYNAVYNVRPADEQKHWTERHVVHKLSKLLIGLTVLTTLMKEKMWLNSI